jgi:hypothetical protein
MQVSLQLNPDIIAQVDKELAGLGMLSRMPAIKKGLRNAGNVVRKRVQETLPKPGYPGDKPGLKPLRDTVATKVKEYPTGAVVAIVGYEWGAGSHGHNVEHGHRIAVGGKVPRLGQSKTVVAPPSVLKVMGLGADGMRSGSVTGSVEGRFDIANAAKSTESAQGEAMSAAVKEAIEETKILRTA